jgi:hypothetical protein
MSITNPDHDQPSTFFPTGNASGLGQSSFDPYELSSNDDEYLTPKCMTGMPSGRTGHAAHLLTVARLNLNRPPASPKNWGLVNHKVHDYQ